MSDKAAEIEAEAEIDPDALFKELAAAEQGKAPDAKAEEAGAGQAEERTPEEGQAPEGTPTEDAGKPPASDDQPDIWKDAPPALREAYEASVKRAEQAENVAKAHGGRLAQAYQERDALAEKIAAAEKAAGPETQQEGDESDEDYRKRMLEDFPEFARLFDKLDTANKEIGALKGSVETATTTARSEQTEAALVEQERVFTQAHPNWEAEKKDAALMERLVEWSKGQPAYVQDALRRNAETITDGQSAADIISRFKAHDDSGRSDREAKRQEQLEGSRDAKVSGPGATKTGADDNDVEGIWKELAAKEARQEHRTRR